MLHFGLSCFTESIWTHLLYMPCWYIMQLNNGVENTGIAPSPEISALRFVCSTHCSPDWCWARLFRTTAWSVSQVWSWSAPGTALFLGSLLGGHWGFSWPSSHCQKPGPLCWDHSHSSRSFWRLRCGCLGLQPPHRRWVQSPRAACPLSYICWLERPVRRNSGFFASFCVWNPLRILEGSTCSFRMGGAESVPLWWMN